MGQMEGKRKTRSLWTDLWIFEYFPIIYTMVYIIITGTMLLPLNCMYLVKFDNTNIKPEALYEKVDGVKEYTGSLSLLDTTLCDAYYIYSWGYTCESITNGSPLSDTGMEVLHGGSDSYDIRALYLSESKSLQIGDSSIDLSSAPSSAITLPRQIMVKNFEDYGNETFYIEVETKQHNNASELTETWWMLVIRLMIMVVALIVSICGKVEVFELGEGNHQGQSPFTMRRGSDKYIASMVVFYVALLVTSGGSMMSYSDTKRNFQRDYDVFGIAVTEGKPLQRLQMVLFVLSALPMLTLYSYKIISAIRSGNAADTRPNIKWDRGKEWINSKSLEEKA